MLDPGRSGEQEMMRSPQSARLLWITAGIWSCLGAVTCAQNYYVDGNYDGTGAYYYTSSYNYQAPNFYSDGTAAQPRNAYSSGPSRNRQASVPQPNYYTNAAASQVGSAADMYSQQGYQVASAQQWDSSYASQQQSPKKRGLVKRMFSRSSANSVPESRGSIFQRGVASWYGGRWHGRKTANGERYDQNSMTAAHRSLPFGTLVKVKNEHNGKECVVRINNRGPFTKGRVIDLSRAAASQIGMIGRGVGRVSMEVLGRN